MASTTRLVQQITKIVEDLLNFIDSDQVNLTEQMRLYSEVYNLTRSYAIDDSHEHLFLDYLNEKL